MLGLMGFSGSLPLCVIIIDIICMFINWANGDACFLACLSTATIISAQCFVMMMKVVEWL